MTKILIVDDNELNTKLMKDILIVQGYDIDTADDGQDGLNKAIENDYDLILLDLQMPLVSGYDFMQKYTKDTPIIVVSACAMDSDIEKAKSLGCKDFLSKPIKLVEFLETVKNISVKHYGTGSYPPGLNG